MLSHIDQYERPLLSALYVEYFVRVTPIVLAWYIVSYDILGCSLLVCKGIICLLRTMECNDQLSYTFQLSMFTDEIRKHKNNNIDRV